MSLLDAYLSARADLAASIIFNSKGAKKRPINTADLGAGVYAVL